MTNYEKIKNMNVDEMEEFLMRVHCSGFMCGAHDDDEFPFDKEWLESEAKE